MAHHFKKENYKRGSYQNCLINQIVLLKKHFSLSKSTIFSFKVLKFLIITYFFMYTIRYLVIGTHLSTVHFEFLTGVSFIAIIGQLMLL